MISRSKQRKKFPEKIGTIADLVDPDLLQLLEKSIRDESDEKDAKIKIIIKKK